MNPLTYLAFCASYDDKPDPAHQLGTVADVASPDALDDLLAFDPLLASQPTCPHVETVQTPSGPRIDPEDPHGIQTLTFLSDPKRPGTLCAFSCLLSTSDCWMSSQADCSDAITIPATFPSGRRGSLSALYGCVQATPDSPIPLRETVTITTSNAPDDSIFYLVKGAD
jgi:hypothetical protein